MRYLIWPILILFSIGGFSQTQDKVAFQIPAQVWAGFQPILEQPLKVVHFQGPGVRSKPMPGIAGELGYFQPISDHWGVGVSGGIRTHSYNLLYSLPDSLQFVFLGRLRINSTLCASLNSGIYLRHWQRLGKGIYGSVEGNAKAYFFPSTGEGIGLGVSDYLLSGDLLTRRSWVRGAWNAAITLKTGLWIFPLHKNSIQANLVGSWSPGTVGSGNYSLSRGDEELKGVVRLRQNYVGLELAYGLSLKRGLKK